MIARLKRVFQEYWVEMLIIPPFLVAVGYLLYGDAYFSSWNNFWWMTFPWIFMSILSPVACHWVRNTTLRRFPRLEDWPQRLAWSIAGYLFFVVGFAKLTYTILSTTRYLHISASVFDHQLFVKVFSWNAIVVIPTEKSFYGLILLASMIVIIITAFYEGITYFSKWKSAIKETEQLEKLTLETQFQSLQSQINPHFLFNSFNVLSSLIAENPRRAEDFVDELSNVYRYLLRSNDRELATVAEELRFIRSFFHLLETRHDGGISLKIDLPPELQNKNLPTLALQILVENAVKHNEISVDKPLHIEIFSQSCTPPPTSKMNECYFSCVLVVRNNFQPKLARAQSNRVGLENLRQRYALLGVSGFSAGESAGFFEVNLPVLA